MPLSESDWARLCGFLRGTGLRHEHLKKCPTAHRYTGLGWSEIIDRKAQEMREDPEEHFRIVRLDDH